MKGLGVSCSKGMGTLSGWIWGSARTLDLAVAGTLFSSHTLHHKVQTLEQFLAEDQLSRVRSVARKTTIDEFPPEQLV
jgi:hypothetical protein